ncbi:transmembrane protein 44 isoform X2 [Amia ocellicauda]|uniref:transmembrane protein 44 isoform X2 n=1 Tax=Amia ocellicauda TaxID=2972642 RepID=UPI003464A4CD
MIRVREFAAIQRNETDGYSFYFSTCFANEEKVCVSFGLGLLSAFLWLIAHLLLVFLRCRKKDRDSGKAAFCAFCCFLGNTISALGASLSNQLSIQIYMGAYMAALDVTHFVLIIFPVCQWIMQTRRSGRRNKMRKRRRQSFFAVSGPLAVGAGYYIWQTRHLQYEDKVYVGRNLLGIFLQDNTEILGFALGLVSVIICWTSKLPHFCMAYRGQVSSTALVYPRVVCILASVCYALAIVFPDRRPMAVLKASPWLLTCLGSVALDSVILLISCCQKPGMNQLALESINSDTQSLLGCPAKQHSRTVEPRKKKTDSDWVPLVMVPNKRSPHKMADIGSYMDINIEQVQEWDFEDTNRQWRKASKAQKGTESFPLQDWTTGPISKPASQPESDFWFYDSDITMTEERVSAILDDYEKEIQKPKK